MRRLIPAAAAAMVFLFSPVARAHEGYKFELKAGLKTVQKGKNEFAMVFVEGHAHYPDGTWLRVGIRHPNVETYFKSMRVRVSKMLFMADIEGSIVALKLDAYAVLNTLLDTRNIDPQHAAGYSLNGDIIPRRLAKCRLVFEPWTGGDLKEEDLKDIGAKKTSGMVIGAGKQPPGGEKAPAPPPLAPENK